MKLSTYTWSMYVLHNGVPTLAAGFTYRDATPRRVKRFRRRLAAETPDFAYLTRKRSS